MWTVNLGAIEFHPLLSRLPAAEHPDTLMFDLDPGEGAGIAQVCAVALGLRDVLSAAGLEAFPKTSGQAGVHVAVPLVAGSATTTSSSTPPRFCGGSRSTATGSVPSSTSTSGSPGWT